MKALLDAGADPNLKNEAGATALMWAVPDAVKMRLLVGRGADVNARSEDGRTPLLITAGYRGALAALRLLLDRGADPSVKTTTVFGETSPLVQIAQSGDQAMFQLLVDRGADVKAAGQNSDGPEAPVGHSLDRRCRVDVSLCVTLDTQLFKRSFHASNPARSEGLLGFCGRR